MHREILLSNVLLDGIIRFNTKLSNIRIANGFGTWEQYILDPLHYSLDEYSCIILILDGESLMESHSDSERLCELFNQFEEYGRKNKGTKIYISNIVCRQKAAININEISKINMYESSVNSAIYKLCQRNENISCINLKKLISLAGEDNAYSKKLEYMSSCPFSIKLLKNLAGELSNTDYFRNRQRKKCLIVDFDNTLWGGVIGEDGKENILIGNNKEGKQYYDFQKILKKIKDSGIVLACSSKNNEEDVKGVFSELRMPLKESDFIAKRISWQPKSISIKEICEELNIGNDSVVFIDDNPAEREQVKKQLPMVEVPDFPDDPSELEDFGLYLYYSFFYIDKVLEEDEKKSEMYAANAMRNSLRNKSINLDSFLRELDTKLRIGLADSSQIQRISQMTQKTNQFNVTTRRYNEQEIERMMKDKEILIYVCRTSDKYGDNGMTNLCIVKLNGDEAYIVEFLMSCRVMERKIEFDFMRFIENELHTMNKTDLFGEYIPTIKNKPASSFFGTYGFDTKRVSNEGTIYHKKIEYSSFSGLAHIID